MKLLVVLPTYNERPNIERVTEGILRHDFTQPARRGRRVAGRHGQIADALAARHPAGSQVLHRQGPRGLGLAYVDGLKRALATDADAIGQMDADLSHDPKYLPDLVAGLDQHDLVIGSRYLRGVSVVNWPLHRIALSAFANRYIRAVTGRVRHATARAGIASGGATRSRGCRSSNARANGYAFLTEMLYEAVTPGLRIGEVPIVFVERQEGYSKVSTPVLVESL